MVVILKILNLIFLFLHTHKWFLVTLLINFRVFIWLMILHNLSPASLSSIVFSYHPHFYLLKHTHMHTHAHSHTRAHTHNQYWICFISLNTMTPITYRTHTSEDEFSSKKESLDSLLWDLL
jgi:hypothetical protein